jgi:hypothetical protein
MTPPDGGVFRVLTCGGIARIGQNSYSVYFLPLFRQCSPVTFLDRLCCRLGVDLRRLQLRMSQELPDLLQRHATVEERVHGRMAQEVRIHLLRDLPLGRDVFEELLHATRGVGRMADGLEERAVRSLTPGG